MDDLVWERRECVSAEVDDALVLLDLDTLFYHSLNVTAAAVWGLLEQPMSTDGLVHALMGRYKVSEENCRASVEGILGKMSASGLVKQVAPADMAAAG